MSAPDFNLEQAVADANEDELRGFAIPLSIRDVSESVDGWPHRNAYCYECGSRENVSGIGFLARCGGCRASERQQARIEAPEARREERYDERSDDE